MMRRFFRSTLVCAALAGLAAPLVAGERDQRPMVGTYKGRYSCNGTVIDFKLTLTYYDDASRQGRVEFKGSYLHPDLGKVTERGDYTLRLSFSQRGSHYDPHQFDTLSKSRGYSTNGYDWITDFTGAANGDFSEIGGDTGCGGQFYAQRK